MSSVELRLLHSDEVPTEIIDHPNWNFSPQIHPRRILEIKTSRYLISEMLRKHHYNILPWELKINDGRWDLSHIFFSLSHTQGWSSACLSLSHAVGVDIEMKNRPVKTETLKRICGKNDDRNLPPIELWCRKEAAFKALSLKFDLVPHLEDISVNNNGFYYQKVQGQFTSFPHDTLTVILAEISPSHGQESQSL